jgi:LytR cell envelope-related transcriptional attenuator
VSGPGQPDRGTAGAAAPTASTAGRPTTTTAPPTTSAPTTTTRAPTTTAAPTTTRPVPETTRNPLAGVTVQVLNGVFVTGLARRVAARVSAAGYEVVAANNAVGSYPVSRIYYTGGHRADAEAFRRRFPAFQQIQPAPANLSPEVALHVVVGKNYPGV